MYPTPRSLLLSLNWLYFKKSTCFFLFQAVSSFFANLSAPLLKFLLERTDRLVFFVIVPHSLLGHGDGRIFVLFVPAVDQLRQEGR